MNIPSRAMLVEGSPVLLHAGEDAQIVVEVPTGLQQALVRVTAEPPQGSAAGIVTIQYVQCVVCDAVICGTSSEDAVAVGERWVCAQCRPAVSR